MCNRETSALVLVDPKGCKVFLPDLYAELIRGRSGGVNRVIRAVMKPLDLVMPKSRDLKSLALPKLIPWLFGPCFMMRPPSGSRARKFSGLSK